eukprot:s2138_g3.t1
MASQRALEYASPLNGITSDAEDDENSSRFWKLDLERAHFRQEMCSWAAIRDTLRFAFWLAVGFGLDWCMDILADKDHSGVVEEIQSLWLLITLGGTIVAFYYRNWWLLGVCVGGDICLLSRDLLYHRTWQQCVNEYVEVSYTVNQIFALFLGPFVAWWFVVTSRALDRLYEFVPRTADIKNINKNRDGLLHFFFGRDPAKEGIFGFTANVLKPLLQVKINRQYEQQPQSARVPLEVDFYKEYASKKVRQPSAPDHLEESSSESDLDPEEALGGVQVETSSPLFGFGQSNTQPKARSDWIAGRQVALIYSTQGHHVKVESWGSDESNSSEAGRGGPGPDEERVATSMSIGNTHFQIKLRQSGQYKRIDEARSFQPLLLFCFGDGGSGYTPGRKPAAPRRRPVLLQSQVRRQECCDQMMCAALAFPLVLGLIVVWKNPGKWGGYASIMYLILPEMVDVLVHNRTNDHDNPLLFGHEGHISRQEELLRTFKEGWDCVSVGNSFMGRLALCDSTFFLVGCILIVLIGCYHLYAVSETLEMLNDLLHIHQRRDNRVQAMLLYRLHHIRGRITNKRCLEFIAGRALPDRLEPDASLSWWFETRAAVFADINFNFEKRKPILGLCLLAELVLILLTVLACAFRENDFVVMCYAASYGLGLGFVCLLFMYLGSKVNTQLDIGLEKVQKYVDVLPHSNSDGSLLSDRRQHQQTTLKQLREYAEEYPLQLKFLGFPFTLNFLSVFAAPLTTFGATVGFWMLQHTLKPFMGSLEG